MIKSEYLLLAFVLSELGNIFSHASSVPGKKNTLMHPKEYLCKLVLARFIYEVVWEIPKQKTNLFETLLNRVFGLYKKICG